ncbi:MAG: hypothetical protein ACLPYS_10970 [Vulcanimicrobiaceae bacterium]
MSRFSAQTTSTRGFALKILGACFERDGKELVAPFDLALAPAELRTLVQPSSRSASLAARIAAAIVKPTAGVVYVGDFDARLQPAQAKRLVGFVPAGGFAGDPHAFACQIRLRADVWGVERDEARRRAAAVLNGFEDAPDPYARALALALIPAVALLVLDQPRGPVGERAFALARGAAVLTTEVAPAVPLALEPRALTAALSR